MMPTALPSMKLELAGGLLMLLYLLCAPSDAWGLTRAETSPSLVVAGASDEMASALPLSSSWWARSLMYFGRLRSLIQTDETPEPELCYAFVITFTLLTKPWAVSTQRITEQLEALSLFYEVGSEVRYRNNDRQNRIPGTCDPTVVNTQSYRETAYSLSTDDEAAAQAFMIYLGAAVDGLVAEVLKDAAICAAKVQDSSVSDSQNCDGGGGDDDNNDNTCTTAYQGDARGPLNTCGDQLCVLNWEARCEEEKDGVPGTYVKVCLTWDNDSWGEPASKTISHMCRNDGTGEVTGWGQNDEECSDLYVVNASGTTEITISMLVKDGSRCDVDGGNSSYDNLPVEFGTASCHPRAAGEASCTGNGVGKECFYTFNVAATTCQP